MLNGANDIVTHKSQYIITLHKLKSYGDNDVCAASNKAKHTKKITSRVTAQKE